MSRLGTHLIVNAAPHRIMKGADGLIGTTVLAVDTAISRFITMVKVPDGSLMLELWYLDPDDGFVKTAWRPVGCVMDLTHAYSIAGQWLEEVRDEVEITVVTLAPVMSE